MKKSYVATRILFLALFVLALSACSGITSVKGNLDIKGAPDWVNEGSNILSDKGGRLFRGVGSASLMGDMALQKSVADDRARAEVVRVLSSYLEVVSSDYMSSARAGDAGATEEAVTRQVRNLSKANLAGARIIGSWRDPKTNIVYSIAELNMNHVKSMLAKVNDMNDGLKRYIETRGDNIFDRISNEGRIMH